MRMLSACLRVSISGRACSTALFRTSFKSRSSWAICTRPRVMRDKSSRSSTRLVMCLTCRMMMSPACRTRCSPTPAMVSIWAAVLIGAKGLRNSWASMAKNSSLRSLSRLSASSASFWSWMSVHVPIQRMISPMAFRTGKARPSAHLYWPERWRRRY